MGDLMSSAITLILPHAIVKQFDFNFINIQFTRRRGLNLYATPPRASAAAQMPQEINVAIY